MNNENNALWSKSVNVVLPAYNEETGLPETIKRIPFDILKKDGYKVDVIVVNNNSTDKTKEIALKLTDKVIDEVKKGYGNAYKTGFKNCDADIIVTADADGTYPMEKIPDLLKIFNGEQLDFLTTNRFPKNYFELNTMKPINRFGNWFLSFVMNIIYGIDIKDSQSGMWIVRKDFLDKLKLNSDGMGLSYEIKVEAIYYEKSKWIEIDIPYYERIGNNKMKIIRDGFTNLLEMLNKRFVR